MKILLLTTHVNLGGIGSYVLSLAQGLIQKGHAVYIASSGGDLVAQLQSLGAQHITVNLNTKSELSPKVLCAYRQLIRIVREQDIQIIHAQTRVTQVLAHLVWKTTAIPYVTTCHGFFQPRLFRKLFSCWGAGCIAISEAVRAHLVNDLRVNKEKIAVVYNGVDLQKFTPYKFTQAQREEIKQSYGLAPDAPIIGTIARLSSVKGQKYLILAMRRVLQDVPRAQLLLIGDGPEKAKLVHLARQLGLEDHVFFGRSTADTSAPLSIMDVFAFPSLIEGLGLAIIEAQAMGLAVVASDVGGIYTLVKDGENGFLVRPQEPLAQAEAILTLLKDKQLAVEMGRRAREQVREKFDLRQMVEGIEQAYAQALNSP